MKQTHLKSESREARGWRLMSFIGVLFAALALAACGVSSETSAGAAEPPAVADDAVATTTTAELTAAKDNKTDNANKGNNGNNGNNGNGNNGKNNGPEAYARQLVEEGRDTFRNDTFASEGFFGGLLQLHDAIQGENHGGFGPGVSPATALAVGLKVDVERIPGEIQDALAAGEVDLEDPATTLALLQLDAVVGVDGIFNDEGTLESVGITCALCHSTVDDSFAPGIGERLDGWANRDLNVGAIVNLAPDDGLQPVADMLHVDVPTVRTVLTSWGPGRYDASIFVDGKAFRPDGETAAVLIPPAFGLAGVNLHTWGGWGSVTHWNAFVANLEMHGVGRFYDPRMNDPEKFPVAVEQGLWDVYPPSPEDDQVTSKLAALHVYQLAIAAPEAPKGSYDAEAADRGEQIFAGQAECATCHVPPLFTEPGYNAHKPEDIGIDSFQADRSPDGVYRTAPLKGLWTHTETGFYHDGRFETLLDVVNHYNDFNDLGLTEDQKNDLVEYLKSL